jgi:hypothetical protein
MKIADCRPTEILRHGAYLCLHVPDEVQRVAANIDVPGLARRFSFENEFESRDGHPSEAIAFLRRINVTTASLVDEELLNANAVVHIASPSSANITQFYEQLKSLLGPTINVRMLRGVVRPMSFTGNAMHNFAYANQVVQQPGLKAPHAFLLPLNKTSEWWKKDWMERHTYFLPRYDDQGQMLNEGHARAAAAGVSCLMRRTYKYESEPAPASAYDFLTYFECAEKHIPVFQSVLTSLRDVTKNPEWNFVREGPTWHGRRLSSWSELFS